MAMSSFKSMTRRNQSGSTVCGAASNPSSSDFSTQNGSHRRSRSKSDLSQKYLSDDSSTSENRFCDQRSRWRQRNSGRHTQPDSESDMEGSFGMLRRRDLNSTPEVGTHDLFYRHCNLGRSSVYDRLSECTMDRKMKFGASSNCNKQIGQHPNSSVQQQTVKSLSSKMLIDPSKYGAIQCDAVLAEIRKAVDMVRTEYQQSIGSSGANAEASEVINCSSAKGCTNPRALADIQKEFADKLRESQQRVRLLWSQLVVEEQRCLEFAKILRELLPDSKSSTRQKVPQRRRWEQGSSDKQKVLKCLHDEAQKYIKESVSILDLNIPGDSSVLLQH